MQRKHIQASQQTTRVLSKTLTCNLHRPTCKPIAVDIIYTKTSTRKYMKTGLYTFKRTSFWMVVLEYCRRPPSLPPSPPPLSLPPSLPHSLPPSLPPSLPHSSPQFALWSQVSRSSPMLLCCGEMRYFGLISSSPSGQSATSS